MFTLLTAIMIQSSSLIALPADWNFYSNPRYGYTTCYPKIMKVSREADNSDGRVFKTKDGGELAVWGENNFNGASLSEYRNSIHRDGEVVAYEAIRPTWFVRSSTQNSVISWRKTYKRDGQFVTLELRYPIQNKKFYDPIVKKLSMCFRIVQTTY